MVRQYVAQHVQQVAQLQLVGATHAAGEELAIEIPDGEAIGGRVELGRHVRLLPAQRVEIGDEMTTHPVHADERGHLHLLVQHRVFAVHRVLVDVPLHRFVRHTEAAEHVVVELVLAQQQLVHA